MLLIVLGFCMAHTLSAQTRRIAYASHSGAGTINDEDNYGLSPAMVKQMHQEDSARKAADTARQQQRPRSRPKQKPKRK
jgi:hypothetical protein